MSEIDLIQNFNLHYPKNLPILCLGDKFIEILSVHTTQKSNKIQ